MSKIEYDVELLGAQKKVQLPFVMGVMANLSGSPSEPLPPVVDRNFADISVDNFDDRLKGIKPRVVAQVPNKLTGEGTMAVELRFESMQDFSPGAIARGVPALRQLLEARTQLANLITSWTGAGAEGSSSHASSRIQPSSVPSLRHPSQGRAKPAPQHLERPSSPMTAPLNEQQPSSATPATADAADFTALLNKEFKPQTERARSEVESAVRTLAEQALAGTTLMSSDTVGNIQAIIGELDRKLSEQVNEIIHHPSFQELESAWRGLHDLVSNSETDQMLKIRVLKRLEGRARENTPSFQGCSLGPESNLQKGLRAGVWSARRRAFWVPGRRLLLRPESSRR